MTNIGVPVLEEATAGGDGINDTATDQYRADRLVAAAQPLGDRHQVGGNALLLAGVQGAGATHTAHHFVEDQQDAVCVAQLAHATEVARRRSQAATGSAADGLGDEGEDIFATHALDGVAQSLHQPCAVLLGRLALALVTVGIGRRDVLDVDQQRRELPAPPLVAANRQRRPACCRDSCCAAR